MRTFNKVASAALIVVFLSGGLSCYYGGGAVSGYASFAAGNVETVSENISTASSADSPAADRLAASSPSSILNRAGERPSGVSTAVVRKLTRITDVAPNLDSSEVVTFQNLTRLARARDVHQMPLDSVVQWVGERFVGSEYVGGLLDASESEELVISFRKFDCVLFVETVLALSGGISQQDYTGAGFANRLKNLRYRNGELDGYESRLHYFSDWIHDNQSMGYVRDITEDLGGQRRDKELNIMSKHRRLYKRLAEDDSLLQDIREMEHRLSEVPQYYVPQENMRTALSLIKPGDIVSTATIARGLDVSHSGFAYQNPDGTIGLLHASSTSGEVTITRSLERYVSGNRFVEGIVVARPVR